MNLTHSIIGTAKIAHWAAHRFGVTMAELLAQTGISLETLNDPHAVVAPDEELRFYRNLVQLCASDDLAIRAGFQLTASCYGVWGLAIQSCDTLIKGIEMGMEYIDFTYTFNRIYYTASDDAGHIVIESSESLEELQTFMVLRDTAAIVRLIYDGLVPKLPFEAIKLSCPSLAHQAIYEKALKCPIELGANKNEVVVRKAQLGQRLNQANKLTWQLCCEQLDALYEQRKLHSRFADRVRQLISQQDFRKLSMEQIARQLKISPRTLRDRLSAEDTSYKFILDTERKQRAEHLLLQQQLTLDQIAEKLGYSDATSFSHACKRWFNASPRNVSQTLSREESTLRGEMRS